MVTARQFLVTQRIAFDFKDVTEVAVCSEEARALINASVLEQSCLQVDAQRQFVRGCILFR